jgi:hypothetical protein
MPPALGSVLLRPCALALQDLGSQVEPGKIRVARFEHFEDAQRLRVVRETAVFAQAFVEDVFARMAERWMANVVRERERFHEVFIESQGTRNRASD